MKSMPVVFTQAFSNMSAQTDTCFNGDVISCIYYPSTAESCDDICTNEAAAGTSKL